MGKVYKFSEFILDEKSLTLYAKDAYISLSSRAFSILLYLIERRGEIVGKDEILDRVWQDSFVEEANLPVHISALRRVLREKKGESRFIRTISGRGYSFVYEVEEIEASQIVKAKNLTRFSEKKDISIAVLPFTFEHSSEDNEYLANGVTQSLIGDLSKIQDLRVLAYSAVKSYKYSELELQEIGFLLDADKILTGIISEYKGHWEISAELINAKDKRCLWTTTQTFKAEDIFKVKLEIASAIIEKLKLKLIDQPSEKKEIDSEAQKLYYRGNFILESRVSEKKINEILYQALKFFKESIKREPSFTLGYVGIGRTFVSLHNHSLLEKDIAYFEVKKALQKALLNGDDISEVYVLKGSVETFFENNFAEAEKSFNKAIELDPNSADAYHWKSIVCLCLGRFEDALDLISKAINLDSTSIRLNMNLVKTLYFYGKYHEAVTLADELLEFNKKSPGSYVFKAVSYAKLGYFELALDSIEKSIKLRNNPEIILHKIYILALFGKDIKARRELENVILSFPQSSIDKSDVAAVYAALNDTEKAFQYLYEAFKEGSVNLTLIKVDRRYENLRNDERFDDLLKKLNLK